MSFEKNNNTPIHPTCSYHVVVPTLNIGPLFRDNSRSCIYVQWFGESSTSNLTGMQFKFPLCFNINDPKLVCDPTDFNVVFVGMIKDWPTKDSILDLCREVNGHENTWIVFAITANFVREYPGGIGPMYLIAPIIVAISDPNCGNIEPAKFCDYNVLNVAKARVKGV